MHPSTPAMATSIDASPALWRVLLWPHVRRLLGMQPFWALAFAAFFKSMEMASPSHSAVPFSFLHYLAGNLIGALTTLSIAAPLWYWLARRHWQRSEPARLRHEQDGMYALLPRPTLLALALTVYLISAPAAYGLWILYLDAIGAWTAERASQASLLIAMIFHGFSMLVIFVVDLFRVKAQMLHQRAEQVQRLHAQAQLQRLQAQLEPHMLFNTLSNLHALIDTQPAAAQDMLAHLIDYLRATLSASRVGSLALKDDMAHVQDYLALMQVRMGDRLKVRLDLAPEVRDVPLPPMLVQPLIENAIKHGLDPLPEGGELHIRAFRENDLLTLQVRDTGRGWASASDAPPHPGHGFGLSCIRERLMASYGGAASLHVASAPASGEPASRGTTVTLRLPLRHPLVPIPSC